MISFFEVLFPAFFVLMFGFFVVTFVITLKRGLGQGKIDRSSPTLDVEAKVIAKRMEVRGEHSRTYYYVTFEVASGDRIELSLEGADYGMIVEGDSGVLTFKGSRFLGFRRA